MLISGAVDAWLTLNIAPLLIAVPALFRAVTLNRDPLSETGTEEIEYVDEVAPVIGEPFFIHWYAIGPVPATATEKLADCAAVTVTLDGCLVITGPETTAFTVSDAGALVTEGKAFDDHSLIVGSPAKAIRTLDKEAVAKLHQSAAHYVENWRRFAVGMQPIDAGE